MTKLRLSPHRVRQISRFVADNLSARLTVGDLAELACLSPFHFARMFKLTTGFPPHKYVMKVRLSEARYLLARSPMSARSIASQVGLRPSELSKQFRDVFGVTPRDYRRGIQAPQPARI